MKIDDKNRSELIRKGNQLFNSGQIEQAAKVFETVNYMDGLIRIGDYYYKKNEFINAIKYYKKAKYKKRIEQLTPEIISVFKNWLSEKEEE